MPRMLAPMPNDLYQTSLNSALRTSASWNTSVAACAAGATARATAERAAADTRGACTAQATRVS